MSSVAATVSVCLTEESTAYEGGGGFARVQWRVHVNDGWLRLGYLVHRRRVGPVSAELTEEDDPHSDASNSWQDRPPQVWWRREILVTAPLGTQFARSTWVPDRERARQNPTMFSVPYNSHETRYELRERGLVPEDVLARKRQARIAPPEKPASPAEIRDRVAAVLASLDKVG